MSKANVLDESRLHPDFVQRQLERHLFVFQQDFDRWKMDTADQKARKSDQLRSKLLIPQFTKNPEPSQSNPVAWHPFIRSYLKTLGLNPQPVDAFFQRITTGDLSDRRAVTLEFKAAAKLLEQAISIAEEQDLSGNELIQTPLQCPAGEVSDVDRACEPLTVLQAKIVRFLWNRKHSTNFNNLADKCWPNGSANEDTIVKRLRDIEKRWSNQCESDGWLGQLDLEISPVKRSVKLSRPGQNQGQK